MPRLVQILLAALIPATAMLLAPAAQATFPGRNGDIAFICYQYDLLFSVCSIPSTGGTRRDVTGEASLSAPRWAPNGRHLLYKSTDEAGLGLVRLPGFYAITGTEGDSQPAWSPRGDRVAAVRFTRGRGGIFTFDLAGRHRRLEVPNGFSPDWSPDGRTLAYEMRGEIYLYDLARRSSRRLTHSPRGSSSHSPSWAPTSRSVAFGRRSGRGAAASENIFTIGVNGRGERQVTRNQAHGSVAGDSDPTWSPDGRLIAFVHAPDNQTGYFLSVITPAGKNQQNLTGPPGFYGALRPDWGRRPR
jgi:Tol biopolymer transport system component